MTGFINNLIDLVRVHGPQGATSTDNSIHDGTGHHRLVEHLQYHAADVEGLLLSLSLLSPEMALALPVNDVHMFRPVQFFVKVHSHVFHTDAMYIKFGFDRRMVRRKNMAA